MKLGPNIEIEYCNIARVDAERAGRMLDELPIDVRMDSNQDKKPDEERLRLEQGPSSENHYVLSPRSGRVFYGKVEEVDSEKYSVLHSPSKFEGISLCIKERTGARVEVEFQVTPREGDLRSRT